MPRVRRPPAPPPPPDPDRAVVPVRTLPVALQPTAKYIDATLGNNDGLLSRTELNAFERAYGNDAGQAKTIALLKRQLELGNVGPAAGGDAAAIAARLVRTGGSGTAEDAAAVAAALSQFPIEVLRKVEAANLHVVACRGSVTDYLTDLRGVAPRGWPPGSTWDQVPGTFIDQHGEVVIATEEKNGARAVPDDGEGQGSFNVVFHETGHAMDGRRVLSHDSESPEFDAAYEADRAALTANHETYLLQPGVAGHQEAWAEMEARYFAHDPSLHTSYPHLDAFFATLAHDAGVPS